MSRAKHQLLQICAPEQLSMQKQILTDVWYEIHTRLILIFQEGIKSNQNEFFAFRSLQLATKTPNDAPKKPLRTPLSRISPPKFPPEATESVLRCHEISPRVLSSRIWPK